MIDRGFLSSLAGVFALSQAEKRQNMIHAFRTFGIQSYLYIDPIQVSGIALDSVKDEDLDLIEKTGKEIGDLIFQPKPLEAEVTLAGQIFNTSDLAMVKANMERIAGPKGALQAGVDGTAA